MKKGMAVGGIGMLAACFFIRTALEIPLNMLWSTPPTDPFGNFDEAQTWFVEFVTAGLMIVGGLLTLVGLLSSKNSGMRVRHH